MRVRDYDQPNGGVILPNPNAPTGRGVTLDFALRIFCSITGTAWLSSTRPYVDFGAQSAVSLLGKYENLLVVQTMSKSRSRGYAHRLRTWLRGADLHARSGQKLLQFLYNGCARARGGASLGRG